MPATAAPPRPSASLEPCLDRLERLGHEGRERAYRRGQLSLRELTQWAAHYPLETPTVNGEIAWIAWTLADRD